MYSCRSQHYLLKVKTVPVHFCISIFIRKTYKVMFACNSMHKWNQSSLSPKMWSHYSIQTRMFNLVTALWSRVLKPTYLRKTPSPEMTFEEYDSLLTKENFLQRKHDGIVKYKGHPFLLQTISNISLAWAVHFHYTGYSFLDGCKYCSYGYWEF